MCPLVEALVIHWRDSSHRSLDLRCCFGSLSSNTLWTRLACRVTPARESLSQLWPGYRAPQLISSPSHWGWLLLIYWLVLLIDVFDYFVLFSIFVLNLLLFLPTSLVQHFLACFNWFVSCLVRRGGPEAAVQFLVAVPFTIPFFFRLMCECKCHGCFKLRTLLLWFVPAAW